MKKICIVTATRAEYGLLKPLMTLIEKSDQFTLQVLATGAHLSPEFGLTYKFIEQDGFIINEKVEMLVSSDTSNAIVKSMGLGMIGYADAFSRLNPDAVIILGDRYEMLSVASVASIFTIPIFHLHGGEITEGAYDDAIRHAISKLSHLHFTSTEEYRQRVIQMGEQPDRVFNVGAIGLDNIYNVPLLTKEDLEQSLGIRFKKYNYQVTFHPETLGGKSAKEQFEILLRAISQQKDSYFVFTKANADTDGRIINQLIDDFVSKNPETSAAYSSLGSIRFLSLVKICNAIVGNSSSGIIEAPSLNTATINIGDRQKGRTQAGSVINCAVEEEMIIDSFQRAKESLFQDTVAKIENPYGTGGTAARIMHALSSLDFNQLKTKKFYNIKHR
ncbi:UDP-N-acetylglucosamine 2-epimerase [Sphingobacterium pedocola]|uniref:UDP-N-acetylglucosamine 2-epimerase (Hydrolyzing) n=1 Tax=Sphingobacterium pedocola TaxID=2082722 RepID=A0ABR9TBM1_9SPHI|nr:UDP-N-acetylglucosamine 2-epimerase [Sphingobacterium pedocola]MBE8722047.1 UDP-N-acetylglucosamine 2-epimerase (hydrolyzing) [Sphingobacterium pedocola]